MCMHPQLSMLCGDNTVIKQNRMDLDIALVN